MAIRLSISRFLVRHLYDGAEPVERNPQEGIMRYALLIYVDEAEYGRMGKEEMDALMGAYFGLTEQFGARLAGGDALQGIATATTVRVRNDQTVTTDGPFAETKEQLAGFYLLNCDNLDDAVQMAAKIPDAVRGSIEVRPIAQYA
jgi:hypothetical protein